jgi:hypothetical protein
MFYLNATHEATACREESWTYHYDDGLGGRILLQQTNPYASFILWFQCCERPQYM